MIFKDQINIETLHLYFTSSLFKSAHEKSRYTRMTREMIDDQRVFITRLLLQKHNADIWEEKGNEVLLNDSGAVA